MGHSPEKNLSVDSGLNPLSMLITIKFVYGHCQYPSLPSGTTKSHNSFSRVQHVTAWSCGVQIKGGICGIDLEMKGAWFKNENENENESENECENVRMRDMRESFMRC